MPAPLTGSESLWLPKVCDLCKGLWLFNCWWYDKTSQSFKTSFEIQLPLAGEQKLRLKLNFLFNHNSSVINHQSSFIICCVSNTNNSSFISHQSSFVVFATIFYNSFLFFDNISFMSLNLICLSEIKSPKYVIIASITIIDSPNIFFDKLK